MDFGVVLQTNPPARRVVELAKRAEANGFTHVWVFDSTVLWQEPFVILARILAETERIIVGPMVTNPGSRDWTVLASTFATLNDAYGPRTICGIGRGDSALRVIGRKPRTLAEMAETMRVVKGLVAARRSTTTGRTSGFRGWRAAGTCRCGARATVPARSTASDAMPTASCFSSPIRRSSSGPGPRSWRPPRRRGAHRARSLPAWSRRPTSATTSLISAINCAGSRHGRQPRG